MAGEKSIIFPSLIARINSPGFKSRPINTGYEGNRLNIHTTCFKSISRKKMLFSREYNSPGFKPGAIIFTGK